MTETMCLAASTVTKERTLGPKQRAFKGSESYMWGFVRDFPVSVCCRCYWQLMKALKLGKLCGLFNAYIYKRKLLQPSSIRKSTYFIVKVAASHMCIFEWMRKV